MKHKNFNEIKKTFKSFFKGRISINYNNIIYFLIAGVFLGINTYADETVDKKAEYVSINSTENANKNGDGATGNNSIAIGVNASSTVSNGIALGNGASVNNAQGAPGTSGIAIGTGAQSHQMSKAMHEVIVRFKRTSENMTGGIAIGTKTHARISTIDIGNRDYIGAIGDITFNKNGVDSWNSITGVGSTTVGDNSINTTNFSTISGAFNTITNSQRNGNRFHNLAKAIQGFGASIVGTLNSIEGNENLEGKADGGFNGILNGLAILGGSNPATGLMYSGSFSNIIGVSNRISKSNGSLIYGAGNEITNSYLDQNGSVNEFTKLVANSFINPNGTGIEIKELADAFKNYATKTRFASVGIIGGANRVDYALFSNVTGVGNTLNGKGGVTLSSDNTSFNNATSSNSIFSTFNNIVGYENKASDVSHLSLSGTKNVISKANKNIISGNNHNISGTDDKKATGNIVLGFNETSNASNFKVSGENIVALGNDIIAGTDNSVYLGNNSKNADTNSSKGLEVYTNDTISGKTLNFAGSSPLGVVSVGSKDKERRIQNVAAGLISATSTDAINGSQLYSLITSLNNSNTPTSTANIEVIGSGAIKVTPKEENDKKTYTISVETAEITSKNGGEASVVEGDKLVKASSLVEAINALGNNTIKLSGNDGETEVKNLNSENGINFKIEGTGFVKTRAEGDKISIDLTDEAKKKLEDIKVSEAKALSGVASAISMANLPQVSNVGGHRHNIAAAYGYYGNEHAISVGLSGINKATDIVYKLSGSLNTKGNVGLGMGIAYQFDNENDIRKDEMVLNKNGNIVLLDEKVYENDMKIKSLEKENKELKEKLEKIEKLLESILKNK